MKVIFFILELSFIISNNLINQLTDRKKLKFDLEENIDHYFYIKLEINQRINQRIVFISFKSEKPIFKNDSLTFSEFDYKISLIREKDTPLTTIEEGRTTTLVAVIIANDPNTAYIAFGIKPNQNIKVSIQANINKIDANEKNVDDLNEGKIMNFNELNSTNFYKFNLEAGYNSYARLELIFDTKNNNYKGFSLSHIVEYQNDGNEKIFYQPFTKIEQGNKTILNFSHLVSDKSTNKIAFQLIPKNEIKNVNILGFKATKENKYEEILSFDNSLNLTSMYPSINYKLMFPIQANQTNQIQLNISNITSLENYSQPVDVYECWEKSFNSCEKSETQNFTMTKNNDLEIFLKAQYQNKNVSIKSIYFQINPSYIFYNITIIGSIIKNDPEPTPDPDPDSDSDSGTSSDSAPDSGSSSFVVSISIIISIIIISVIVFFIYLYIKKRRSKDFNFDQRDSLGDDFLLNE